MSSLIEQAALRLEQLRRAGADIAGAGPDGSSHGAVHDYLSLAPLPGADAAHGEASRARHTVQRVEIDLERLERAGLVTPQTPRSQMAEQFRVIKRPLISNAIGKGAADVHSGNLIMVTSALPGEGKTFTAINLAMSLSNELDTTVLLVDADVTRPSVMDTLGLPPARGLLDLLQDEQLALHDTLLRTNIDKLVLLPSGTAHPRATELLASEAMVRLVQQLATRYADRIIVFDSPPLLLTTESRVLASHMGQVVVVVRAETTLQSDVLQALGTIESCPVRLMLLNQARRAATGSYGAYGYAYDFVYDPGTATA